MTKVRDEPSDYAQAAAGYFQAQFELSRRTAEAFAGVMQKAQADTVELVSTTGQRATEQAAAGAESTATTTATKTKGASKAAR